MFSCESKKNKEASNIFPSLINKYSKISEKIEKNSKKLSLYQKYNENNSMLELVNAKYKSGLEINRYRYKTSLYAYSEFSTSRDSSYNKFNKSEFAYQVTDYIVVLSDKYIYTISLALCDLDKLGIKPKTDIKIPKSKFDSVINSEKLFINDDKVFPFFKSYLKRERQYKNTIIHTMESFKKDDVSMKELTDFISKQKITETTDKYIIFSIEDEEALFLWNKKLNILFLNFSETDLEKIKKI